MGEPGGVQETVQVAALMVKLAPICPPGFFIATPEFSPKGAVAKITPAPDFVHESSFISKPSDSIRSFPVPVSF